MFIYFSIQLQNRIHINIHILSDIFNLAAFLIYTYISESPYIYVMALHFTYYEHFKCFKLVK